MTPLRQRLIEDMQLRGFSPRTQEAYVHAVHRLAQHFHKSPDLITDEDLRQYFLHLTQVQHYARPTVTIALCGIKFFVERTLGKTFTTLSLMRPPHERKLPLVLGREEVRPSCRSYACRSTACVLLPSTRVACGFLRAPVFR